MEHIVGSTDVLTTVRQRVEAVRNFIDITLEDASKFQTTVVTQAMGNFIASALNEVCQIAGIESASSISVKLARPSDILHILVVFNRKAVISESFNRMDALEVDAQDIGGQLSIIVSTATTFSFSLPLS